MGYAQWSTWKAVKAVGADRAIEARVVAVEKEQAVTAVRIASLEAQVKKLWERRR
jgi:hypothetical protein